MIRLLVFAAIGLGCLQAANANHLVVLRSPYYGCARIADVIEIVRLARGAPHGFQNAAVRAYVKEHCLELSSVTTTIVTSDGDFVCLRRFRAPCLWTLRAWIRTTMMDDGVF